MIVEHFDVVAGVFLGGERVELAADRINRLSDVLGGPVVGPLEQHVLDEVRDPTSFVAFMAGPAHQPDANGHRPHVRHGFGD
jgi:hypothetical protein